MVLQLDRDGVKLPTVLLVMFGETRWPAVPLKVSEAVVASARDRRSHGVRQLEPGRGEIPP